MKATMPTIRLVVGVSGDDNDPPLLLLSVVHADIMG
jgi:hypothetical protein